MVQMKPINYLLMGLTIVLVLFLLYAMLTGVPAPDALVWFLTIWAVVLSMRSVIGEGDEEAEA